MSKPITDCEARRRGPKSCVTPTSSWVLSRRSNPRTTVLAPNAPNDVCLNTGVTWIGYADEWAGIARVFVDGTLRATVDTYSSPSQARKPLFTVSGLAPGSHTLRIEVTGTRNAASGGAWIWVDAFDVAGGS